MIRGSRWTLQNAFNVMRVWGNSSSVPTAGSPSGVWARTNRIPYSGDRLVLLKSPRRRGSSEWPRTCFYASISNQLHSKKTKKPEIHFLSWLIHNATKALNVRHPTLWDDLKVHSNEFKAFNVEYMAYKYEDVMCTSVIRFKQATNIGFCSWPKRPT